MDIIDSVPGFNEATGRYCIGLDLIPMPLHLGETLFQGTCHIWEPRS